MSLALNPFDDVTRFEVIDHRQVGVGRALVHYDVTVNLSIQDEGRTLKVFITDRDDV